MCGGRERKSGSSAERSIGEGGKNLDAQTLGAACLGTGTTSEKTIIAAPGEVLGSNTDRNSNAKFYRRWRADQGACTGSSAIQGQLLMATRDREL